jgi:hypothetical protein
LQRVDRAHPLVDHEQSAHAEAEEQNDARDDE